MNSKVKIILAIVLGALLVVAAIFAAVSRQEDQKPKPTHSAVMGVHGDVPHGTDSKPTESAGPEDGANSGGDELGTNPETDDMSKQVNVAKNAIEQYIRYDRSETAASRAARLTPYLAPGSSLAKRVPALAQESKWGYVGFDAKVIVNNVDYISVSGINDSQTLFKITALVTYQATYSTSAQSQTNQDRKTWDIWVTTGDIPLVYSIDEPAID